MGENFMFKKEGNVENKFSGSLSKKIIAKLSVVVAIIFLLIVTTSGYFSMLSLTEITNSKLVSSAYENAFLIQNSIEGVYGQVIGFANSLKNLSTSAPKQSRK